MKPKTMSHLSWWLLAMVLIGAVSVAGDVVEHAIVFVPLAALAVAAGYVIGRRHGSRNPTGRDRARRAADTRRLAQLADLEQMAGRPVEAMLDSYRAIQRQYRKTGDSR